MDPARRTLPKRLRYAAEHVNDPWLLAAILIEAAEALEASEGTALTLAYNRQCDALAESERTLRSRTTALLAMGTLRKREGKQLAECEAALAEVESALLRSQSTERLLEHELRIYATEPHAPEGFIFVEGDARCGSRNEPSNATCLLEKGHKGNHRNTQGYWL